MGKKYNVRYKKGKFLTGSIKSRRADYARRGKLTEDYKLWKSDTRKYDFPGLDTPRDHSGFKYKYRSKKKKSPSGRTYRRYYYGK